MTKAKPNKLSRLKQWFTVEDAAKHLSETLDAPVTEADLLQLALDGRLTLSVRFATPTEGRPVKIVSGEDAEQQKMPNRKSERTGELGSRVWLKDGRVLEVENDVVQIEGVWDLPMIGAERFDVEHRYQILTDGLPVTSTSHDGALLSHENGLIVQLVQRLPRKDTGNKTTAALLSNKPRDYRPARELPDDAVFVVRAEKLGAFSKSLEEQPVALEKPLGKRQLDTLLVIIAGTMKHAELDWTPPQKAADIIEAETKDLGARVSSRTILEYLNKIGQALEDKTPE